jgi:hypothetical protein
MEQKYKIKAHKGSIDFENASDGYVEVVFAVNGHEIRGGMTVTENTKGFCFPPGYRKAIKADLKPGDTVQAHIYEGDGKEKLDLDRPAFMRQKEGRRAVFHRASSDPVEILTIEA